MDSSIVVGTTNGNVINKKIISNLANDAFVHAGKGSFHPNAIKIAEKILIYTDLT